MAAGQYPIRTRIAGDIVAEVVLPERQTGRVAILASGLPSTPSKGELLFFLASQGYVAILPRYRGTWESGGSFLARSPAQDIRDVIDELTVRRSIVDVFTGETVKIRVSAVHLFGSSFGGPAVLLNSDLPIVKKIVAVSPVIDWTKEGEDEPFDQHVRFVAAGFGGAYRTERPEDWQKLVETDFYSPALRSKEVDGRKICIIHALDDRVVPYEPLIGFAQETGARYYLKPRGGHGLRIRHLFLWKKISAFLESR